MRTLILGALVLCCAFLPGAPLWAGMCSAPHFPPDRSLFVADDGNNLRQSGGPNYAKAPILAVLNAGDEVGLIDVDGKWANVETVDGVRGWISAKNLLSGQAFLKREQAQNKDMYQECGQLGDIVTSFPMDIDGDGGLETMTLTCQPGIDCANFTMRITEIQGGIVFQGPAYGDSPLIFCQCGAGSYYPTLVGDLDGDGKAEILAEYAPSDLSASSFWLGDYDGKGFKTLLDGKSLVENPAKPGFFAFADPPMNEYESGVRWLMSFSGWSKDGKARGTVFQIRKNPQTGDATDVYTGEGLFTPEKGGFTLTGWEKPFALAQ